MDWHEVADTVFWAHRLMVPLFYGYDGRVHRFVSATSSYVEHVPPVAFVRLWQAEFVELCAGLPPEAIAEGLKRFAAESPDLVLGAMETALQLGGMAALAQFIGLPEGDVNMEVLRRFRPERFDG